MFVSLEAARADFDATTAICLGDRSPLKVGIFARITARIELGSTNTVRITAGHATRFLTDHAKFC